ncbi:MBL fold metallo-hydrolase [Nakamurella leprariae]|uniref:MBL fold metallo-hydrolase n=1 Tax=Nakamurella leprariae TaxID=2803911 RepID=A0A938YIB1_9ACTN|nr:MBL fold metallo-hydrolase [Nakamurella leprariae]MBM9468363.1 MBL fold metallo-hydrolase [Nakamurella leprariae]
MALGDVIRIDDRTVLVVGQEMVIARNQPDVGNALIHRVGELLVMVDTGVTTAFRDALRRAVTTVGDWTDLLLLTSHGHVDHIGNNDLVDDLVAQRGRGGTVTHFVPARDVAQMQDPRDYWERVFDRVAGVVPMPAQPAVVASKVVSLFQPMTPFGRTTRTFEELPLESIRIGSQRSTGWTFADGAVRVLRSQGHCAGHVVVHLRDAGVLHLGDEPNGACGVMVDADQLKLTETWAAAATMIDDGVVTTLTDGHTPGVEDAQQAAARLATLLEQAATLQSRSAELVAHHAELPPADFVGDYTRLLGELDVGGANPNPMFIGMMALNTLRELGWSPDGAVHRPWRPPTARVPERTAVARAAAGVSAGAGLVAWYARGRNR